MTANIYKNHRAEPYFTFVREGKKTVEGRLVKGKYAEIKTGDSINIHTNDEADNFWVNVVGVRKYQTFRELLEQEGAKKVLPNAKDVEDGVSIYREFYSEADEQKYGVVAIEVEVANAN